MGGWGDKGRREKWQHFLRKCCTNYRIRAKLEKMLDKKNYTVSIEVVTKISVVGSGISNHPEILKKIVNVFDDISKNILELDVSACKISILFSEIVDIKYLNELHDKCCCDNES